MDIIHNPPQPTSGHAMWIFPSLFTDYISNTFHQVSAPYLRGPFWPVSVLLFMLQQHQTVMPT